jgi:hypothetical protein
MAKTEIMISVFLNNIGKTTVGDVRQWLRTIDQFNISDNTEVSDAILSVDLFIQPEKIESINCGDHLIHDPHYDILINLHDCENRNR